MYYMIYGRFISSSGNNYNRLISKHFDTHESIRQQTCHIVTIGAYVDVISLEINGSNKTCRTSLRISDTSFTYFIFVCNQFVFLLVTNFQFS